MRCVGWVLALISAFILGITAKVSGMDSNYFVLVVLAADIAVVGGFLIGHD